MFYLRIFSFILVAWLFVSQLASGMQQKHFYQQNQTHSRLTKISSIGTDQITTSDVGLLSSSSERKTLIVYMKSLASDARGLTVYDSGKLIYRFDNYQETHSQKVCLLDLLGELVYTISRKRFLLARPWWEGHRGSEHSNKATFRVKEHYGPRGLSDGSTMCVVKKSDHTKYNLKPCRINRLYRSNAKLEFKLIDAKGKTIAELKQWGGDGEDSLGRDVFSLDVEANVDVPFVVALSAVFGMINHKI